MTLEVQTFVLRRKTACANLIHDIGSFLLVMIKPLWNTMFGADFQSVIRLACPYRSGGRIVSDTDAGFYKRLNRILGDETAWDKTPIIVVRVIIGPHQSC